MSEEIFGAEAPSSEERLARLMARRGLCSRREAEDWIREGRVTVDGVVIKEPMSVDPDRQVVKVDGRRLPPEPRKLYLLMNKPKGFITGREDPQGRRGVHELLGDLAEKVEPVGRLDFDTEGALIFTNDGELAHLLTHPSRQVPRRYMVKVYRRPSDEKLKAISDGAVFLEDGRVPPALVRVTSATDKDNCWVEITVTEGRNRLIRRLFAQLRHPVAKLRRESFGTVSIRGLERGQVRALTAPEVERLRDLARGVKPQRAGHGGKKPGHAIAKPKATRRVSKATRVVRAKRVEK